jgi:hypothetical protein
MNTLFVTLPTGELSCTATLVDFPGYVFHTSGKVWSNRQQRFLQGYISKRGYRRVTLIEADGQSNVYRLSRLIAKAFLGPANGRIVDHRDRIKTNDSAANLRYVTPLENNFNRTNTKNSSSAYLGVSFRKDIGKWCAAITVRGQRHYLGFFTEEVDASKAYQAAKQRLHAIPEPIIGLSPADVANALTALSRHPSSLTLQHEFSHV